MSNNSKVKGLLKGLRFISQIFDNEKEPEIEIGHPTDVKHVAHIGCDGPSENSPSWMNDFKSVLGISSAPLNSNGDIHSKGSDNSAKWISEDSMKRDSRSANCQGQEKELPKSSRRQSNSTGNIRESHAKEKSDRPRHPKKSSNQSHPNDSFNGSKPTEQLMNITDMDSMQLHGSDLPPRSQQDIPRRSHSKKTRDASNVGGSSRIRSKAQTRDPNLNEGTPSRSSSKSRNKHRSLEENEQVERGSNEDILRNYAN
ncbi:CRIB domain-containing protein RIC7-like [Gastrolobium bilobum]|uniref:CRIB domain-containing protein RIC7-like n=1 Tax=Gastrolobium bilobum TaxID=150636 RepID=UPI002AB0D94B|nr:CRIB domain-containing protein RIC7-like [Gastrolobium bilobum]